MRIRPRHHRPQTGVTLIVLGFLIALIIWAVGELGRFGWGRVTLGAVSAIVFLFFAVGCSYTAA